MFGELTFSEASDLFQAIKAKLPDLYSVFGEAGAECITAALHVYVESGFAEESCDFDVDFCHLFCLAAREYNGHDMLPEYSCLTKWTGAKPPFTSIRFPNPFSE